MQKGYKIGEVSRISGISKDTLHFYRKIGLLVPENIDPDNGYAYYSRWNLWQLDIITMCRKMNMPIERIREIMAARDNDHITEILMHYREEALRLSRYYQQVSDDILWYGQENRNAAAAEQQTGNIIVEYRPEEYVLAGREKRERRSYHADLVESLQEILRSAESIQRRYGYVLDTDLMQRNQFVKCREMLRLPEAVMKQAAKEIIMTLPAGEYVSTVLRVQEKHADFSPLLNYLAENKRETDFVYAEEIGLQLSYYVDDYYCTIRAHLIAKNG